MKKYLFVGLIGFVLGNAFWYLASPLWVDRVVSETLVRSANSAVIKSGTFKDADASHRGSGQVEIIETAGESVLRFSDFEVTNGPDLFVWLVKDKALKNSDDVKSSPTLELQPLKGNIGDQNYTLPAGINIDNYGSVVVWCKQFGVLFASAELN
ncbi:MAG: DM13 domain-containing protein [Arenicellales bacterium]